MKKEIEEKLNQMFPHFSGYDDIRLEMAQLIDLVENHDLYAKKVIHFPRGWLLYGDSRNVKGSPIRRIDRGNIDVAANLIPYLLLYLDFLSPCVDKKNAGMVKISYLI